MKSCRSAKSATSDAWGINEADSARFTKLFSQSSKLSLRGSHVSGACVIACCNASAWARYWDVLVIALIQLSIPLLQRVEMHRNRIFQRRNHRFIFQIIYNSMRKISVEIASPIIVSLIMDQLSNAIKIILILYQITDTISMPSYIMCGNSWTKSKFYYIT